LKNIKVVLLSPIVFDKYNNDLVEKIILKLDTKKINNLFTQGKWEHLDKEDEYLHDINGEIDIKDALSRERNLNPQIYKNFSDPLVCTYKNIDLTINSNLIVNEKHNFLLLFEFTFTNLPFNTCDAFVADIMSNRNLFQKTDNLPYYNKIREKLINIFNKFIISVLKDNSKKITDDNFTFDSNYPLIFINGFQDTPCSLSTLFFNEEDAEQRSSSSLITHEYENSFIHIGWNYGLVKDVPKNVSQKYLCMLIFLQLYYYLLRFYKNYFQKRIQSLSSQNKFNEKEIKNFDKLKLLYHKEYLSYKTYKSGLYPRYYKEFSNIEILWHMQEDISFIEKTFQVQNEYINKHFQLETDKTNRNLNYGISIIGIIQVFAIYSIFSDYLSLKKETTYPYFLNYATISVVTTLIAIFIAIIFLYKKSKDTK